MSLAPPRILAISSLIQAEQELRLAGVDPAGVAAMAPKMLNCCIRLSAMSCLQANILKQEMLSLGGDAAVARGTVGCSIPHTDVILMGTGKQLLRLCDKLQPQPFGLAPLGSNLKTVIVQKLMPPMPVWQTSRRSLHLNRPLIMGILNITPDSFSDGGAYLSPGQALERARILEQEGADIIDVGGESTRPGAQAVAPDEEIRRVVPVIEQLARTTACAISIDTRKGAVARAALDAGAEIINDVSAFEFDPPMIELAAERRCGVVLMHSRGTPDVMQQHTSYTDLMGDIHHYLGGRLEHALAAGIPSQHIVLDPGIGFGKTPAGNLEILRRLAELASLGQPLLVGPSRKSFIGAVLNNAATERLHGTAAAVALAVAHGATIVRVHDVAAMGETARIAHAISST